MRARTSNEDNMIVRNSTVAVGMAWGVMIGALVPADRLLGAVPNPDATERVRPTLDRLVRLPHARRTARTLLEELAGALSMPLVISPTVPSRSLDAMTQLGLSRSTGAQAIEWASEITGLGLSVVDDLLVVSSPGSDRTSLARLGVLGQVLKEAHPRSRQRAEADVLQRISDVDLVDASLTQALIHIGDQYHIDLVADSVALAGQELVRLKFTRAPLRIVLDALCDQCGVTRAWMASGFLFRSKDSIDAVPREPAAVIGRSKTSAGQRTMLRLEARELGLNTLLTHLVKVSAMNTRGASIRHAERGRTVTLEGQGSPAWLIDALIATPPQRIAASTDGSPNGDGATGSRN